MKISLDIPDDVLQYLQEAYTFECETYKDFGKENPDQTLGAYLVHILREWGSFPNEVQKYSRTLYDIRKMVDTAINTVENGWK